MSSHREVKKNNATKSLNHKDSQRTNNQHFINIDIHAFVASCIFGVYSWFNIEHHSKLKGFRQVLIWEEIKRQKLREKEE